MTLFKLHISGYNVECDRMVSRKGLKWGGPDLFQSTIPELGWKDLGKPRKTYTHTTQFYICIKWFLGAIWNDRRAPESFSLPVRLSASIDDAQRTESNSTKLDMVTLHFILSSH